MYINNTYIHHRPDHSIRIDSHKHEAQLFLQNKYTWSTKLFHSINWYSRASCFLSLPDSLKRFSLRFIHHRLSTGNMLFDSPHRCLYCKITFTSSSAHDNFLTCPSTSSNEYIRLRSINTTLSTLHTPPLLQQHVFYSLSKVYNIELSSSKYSIFSLTYSSSEVFQCIQSRSLIGWNHFIRRRISKSFSPIINEYYTTNKL